MAKQIVDMAKQKYGNSVSMAVRSPEVRQLLQLYADSTGQKSNLFLNDPHGVNLVQSGGSLYQSAVYNNGTPYSYASNLPTMGFGGATIPTGNPFAGGVTVTVSPEQTANLWATGVAAGIAGSPRQVLPRREWRDCQFGAPQRGDYDARPGYGCVLNAWIGQQCGFRWGAAAIALHGFHGAARVGLRVNEYHDGSRQAAALVSTSRRSWALRKRLTASVIQALWAFWAAHPHAAFYIYDPKERATGQPVGSNYDATGNSTTGRYTVRFNGDWNQSTGILRSDCTLELIEVA